MMHSDGPMQEACHAILQEGQASAQYNALQRHTRWEELSGESCGMQQRHAVTLPCWGMVGPFSLVSRLPQLQTSLEMSAHSSAFVS